MARGYTDFFGYSVFPNYGTSYRQSVLVATVDIGTAEEVFSLAGKGVLLGGHLRIQSIDDLNECTVTVDIDGETVFNQTPEFFWHNLLLAPSRAVAYLTEDDRVDASVVISFTPNLPFGQTFVVTITNGADARNYTINGHLFYTLIEGI